MSSLVVNNLSVAYSEKNVLKNVSFTQLEGEVIVILGASGDGKSTLLKAIAGLLVRTEGEILFDSERVLDPSEQLVPGHSRIKLVNQDFNLDDFHTVEENIKLRLLAYNQSYQEQRLKELLRLTGLATFRNQRAKDLSGGQRQRLAIARALADEPDFILLDEPFNQLDFQTKNRIERHIKNYLKKYKIGAIMVTHNGVEALEWADRILLLEKGKITRDDVPEVFFNFPRSLKEARFFGEVNKVIIGDEKIYFRPSFFSPIKDAVHAFKMDVQFVSKNHLGWYSAYRFKIGTTLVQFYSVNDISSLKTVYIRKIMLND